MKGIGGGVQQIKGGMGIHVQRHAQVIEFLDIQTSLTLFDLTHPGMRNLQAGGDLPHIQAPLNPAGAQPEDQGAVTLGMNGFLHLAGV